MNRRKAIKGLTLLGLIGVSSASIYEWYFLNAKVPPAQFFSKKELITELAESIIPRTNTPGAKDAHVENYILNVLTNCIDPRTQNKFMEGLTDLEHYVYNNYGRSFIKCNNSEKQAVLKHFEEKSKYPINILNKINNKYIGKPFFVELKELTVQGYCISQLGATQGLAYDHIPSNFEACIPLIKNQRSWATK